MADVYTILVQWIGVIVSAVLMLLVIFSTAGSSLTKDEKRLAKDEDAGHYLVSNSAGGFAVGLIVMIAAAAICFFIGWLAIGTSDDTRKILTFCIEIAIAVIAAIVFLVLARNSLVARVLVNGNEILIHPAFGKPMHTSFDQIRTVKKNGGETAMASDSLVLRPTGNRRFKVKKTMKNYDLFAQQVERDVKLPNLTKKRVTEAQADDWDETDN